MPFSEETALTLQLNRLRDHIDQLMATADQMTQTLQTKLPTLNEIQTATRLITQSGEAITLTRALTEHLAKTLPNLLTQQVAAALAQAGKDLTTTTQTLDNNSLRLHNRLTFWGTLILALQAALALLSLFMLRFR